MRDSCSVFRSSVLPDRCSVLRAPVMRDSCCVFQAPVMRDSCSVFRSSVLPDRCSWRTLWGVFETGWRGLNSSCYYLNENKLNWTDARKWCLERSSYLVEIESELENSFLSGIAADAGYNCYYYIGLNKHDVDNTWKWNTSGNSVNYRSWYEKQPDGDGRCGQYDSAWKQWNDIPCERKHCFICERTGKIYLDNSQIVEDVKFDRLSAVDIYLFLT
ncbi:perlucin-like protein [Ruditapes philippinarum]|uniref:perlucin-like protein n=1 Tax=Ruditapes philippinarum TaxID=129788 RepID=UPI00295AF6B7|nr:perlucin-like protein [Ruditapes philippinarum]